MDDIKISSNRSFGNCILDKSKQNLKLKKDYTKEFELD